jgi:hypothetical protein
MANDSSSNTSAPGELVARLGELLMALVAGKDLRVRQTIASAVTRARPHDDMELKTRWHARHDPAANRRVE